MARQPKTARLTERAERGWDRLCTRRNVTYTTVIEALGEALADDPTAIPDTIIRRAQDIDRERRSRR